MMLINYIYSFNFEIIFFLFLLFLLIQKTVWSVTTKNNNFLILTFNISKLLLYLIEFFFIIFIFKFYFFTLFSSIYSYLYFIFMYKVIVIIPKYLYFYLYVTNAINFYSYVNTIHFIFNFSLLLPKYYLKLVLIYLIKITNLWVYMIIKVGLLGLKNILNYFNFNIFIWIFNFNYIPNFSDNFSNIFFDHNLYHYNLFDYSYFNFYNKYIILLFITIYYLLILLYYKLGILSKKKYFNYNYLFNYEYPILIGFLFLGYILVTTSNNLFIIYLGFEIQTFSILILSGQLRQFYTIVITSLKYFFYSFISSLFFLISMLYLYNFGFSLNFYELNIILIYNLENSLTNVFINIGIIFLLLSFFFKLGVFPFYIWVLDIFEGFPRLVVLLLLTLNKFNLFIFLLKFITIISVFNFNIFNLIIHILTITSLLSLLVGSILAITQTNIHRFFGATSITHMGLLLLLIKVNIINSNYNTLYLIYSYFILYMLMTYMFLGILILWSGILNIKYYNDTFLYNNKLFTNFNFNYIKDFIWFNLFSKKSLFVLIMLLFNLSGFPPFSFFFIKFNLISYLVFNNLFFDALLVLYFSVLITGSYIRLISIIYLENNTSNLKIKLLKYYYQINRLKTSALKFFIVIFEYLILYIIFLLLFYNYFIIFIL